jgi:hypothetical protein
MHPEVMLADGEYYRSGYYREVAHRRLVAQAQAVPRHERTMGVRLRVHAKLVQARMRLPGLLPTPKRAALVDHAPGTD